jgi:NAD(P)-dependent dehydrogenase (short-subunit alcohol dehydrogenase family)
MRHAAEHWRTESKALDGPVYGRIVNTGSEAMLFGSPGQPNYAPAKAAVVQLTLVAANSLGRIGVTANAIAPRARTRMTAETPSVKSAEIVDGFDPYGPEHVSPVVAFLAHEACPVTGECLSAVGGFINRLMLSQTTGVVLPNVTIEDVRDRWADFTTEDGATSISAGFIDTSEWRPKRYKA